MIQFKKRSGILIACALNIAMFMSACSLKPASEPEPVEVAEEEVEVVSSVAEEVVPEETPAEETPAPVETSTELKGYLDRIAAGEITNYTVSTLEHGPLVPTGVDPTQYLTALGGEATFDVADSTEAPDGEYVVLAIPDEKIRFDFLPNVDGKNYIRAVVDETQETLYLAKYTDESVNTNEIAKAWYKALVEARIADGTIKEEVSANASPAWVDAIPSAQDENVTQLFVVAGTDMNSSTALVSMHYRGENGKWEELFSVDGVIGKDGMVADAEHVEGAIAQTPIGTYRFNKAFGVADDPGCQIEYTKVDENDYWSGDDREGMPYNQLVDIQEVPDLSMDYSVHIVDFEKEYQYCLNISFNEDATPGKGSAVFLYTQGEKAYTGGGVAIPAEQMKTVMEMVNPDCVVVIDTMDKLGIEHEVTPTPTPTPTPMVGTEYTAYDINGGNQGKLVLHDDGYYYSNDNMRYKANGDGSFSGVDVDEVLYNYDPTNGQPASNGDLPGAFQVWDGQGGIQGYLSPRTDSEYFISNDGQRYKDNGDGSYYGVDTGDTLYNYDPTGAVPQSNGDLPGAFKVWDYKGDLQGYLSPRTDSEYFISNDGMRYRDNGDGSYYGVDTGDTLYSYQPV